MKRNDILNIENAKILFRNFSGKESQYNRAGDRNFSVILDDPEVVEQLQKDGWNIHILEPKEEGDEPRHILRVAVSFKNIPPKVYLVTSRKKTLLTEDTIGNIDFAEIRNVDLSISPYYWTIENKKEGIKSGVKAYLKTMYVTIEEDVFANKYDELDDGIDPDEPFIPFH